jgi:hypothetical protein
MNILSENEETCTQAPKKETPCIPIAESRGFTARNDKSGLGGCLREQSL